MVPNGSKQLKIAPNSSTWAQVLLYEFKFFQIGPNWSKLVQIGQQQKNKNKNKKNDQVCYGFDLWFCYCKNEADTEEKN